MEAVKTPVVVDPFRETRLLLHSAENDGNFLEFCGNKILRLLQEVRFELLRKKMKLDEFQEIETRWTRLQLKKPNAQQIKRIISDTQQFLDEVLLREEKKCKKQHSHQIRETLQKLFMGDNREILLHWEMYEYLESLLRHEMFEDVFAATLRKYEIILQEWKKIYAELIFLIKKEKDEAFRALQERKKPEELKKFGKYLEKMLDEITEKLTEWESAMRLI